MRFFPPHRSSDRHRRYLGAKIGILGVNGAGKSTALQVLAGHFMVPKDQVRVLGRPAFHDTQLTTSGDLSYLGGTWRQDVAFAGYGVALQGDFAAGEMIRNVKGTDPARVDHLIKMLDIDEGWRMTKVSDGKYQREYEKATVSLNCAGFKGAFTEH